MGDVGESNYLFCLPFTPIKYSITSREDVRFKLNINQNLCNR